jgi:hypothetical protein
MGSARRLADGNKTVPPQAQRMPRYGYGAEKLPSQL